MAPEIGTTLVELGPFLIASMRPGHDGPGNKAVESRVLTLTPASMRPGHDGPGNIKAPVSWSAA